MTSAWGRLSFSAVLLALAVVTLVGVVGLRLIGAGVYSLAFLVLPIGAGGWYLYENRDHPPIDLSGRAGPATAAVGGTAVAPQNLAGPGAPPAPSGETASAADEPMPSPDEPFDDPVELADRLDSTGGAAPPDERSAPEKSE